VGVTLVGIAREKTDVHVKAEDRGFREEDWTIGMTATTRSVWPSFLLTFVRHALVPLAHYCSDTIVS
jgi:hypothetical protein